MFQFHIFHFLSARSGGSPQTPLTEHMSHPFHSHYHDQLHQPFCSPDTFFSAVLSRKDSELHNICEERLDGKFQSANSVILVILFMTEIGSPKATNSLPSGCIWSPEQQAILCPVNIGHEEIARQAQADARSWLVCSCSSGKGRICHIHSVDITHAKLNLFWQTQNGQSGLHSPASNSPPSSQLRRLAVTSMRSKIEDDNFESCSSFLEPPAQQSSEPGKGISVGCQTDFQLPWHPVTQAEFCAAFERAIVDDPLSLEMFRASNRFRANLLNTFATLTGNQGTPPSRTGSEWKRRRSGSARDDVSVTPRRPPSTGNNSISLIRRRSFGELDLSPIHGESSDSPDNNTEDRQSDTDNSIFLSFQAPNSRQEMIVDEENNRPNTSPTNSFQDADVMSSTYYTDCLYRQSSENAEVKATNSIHQCCDTGYQSEANSNSNVNATN